MEKTTHFYCDYLGMRLVKTIALPDGGQHFFFNIDGAADISQPLLAYFWFPRAKPGIAGVSAPDMEDLLRTGWWHSEVDMALLHETVML